MNTFKAGLKPPPLIRILKNVLEQNPDNGQILKELLQNAEDAGATEVKFLLDCTTYGKTPKKLFHPEMANFQGPALYAYNNAEFKDEDWAGICMINHSVKETNPQKIGRFGVGFKSVFHMTDFPGVLTGSGVGFIDPHENYFKDENGKSTTCYAWNLKFDQREILSHADQFEPFLQLELFGTSWETLRSGYVKDKTLFRFPLRSSGTKLSDTTYTPEKVRGLFEDLEKDAHIILLFMKNIQKIEIFEKKSNTEIIKTLEIKLTDSCVQTVRQHRQSFSELTRNLGSPVQNYVTFPIDIQVSKYRKQVTSKWMLSLYYGEDDLLHDECNDQNRLSKVGHPICPMRIVCEKLGVLPWVGAAMEVSREAESATCVSENQTEISNNNGRIFCFLPLPSEEHNPTGLACHVHGTFSLDQSRQHVKWPNADQNTGNITDYSLRWNIFLRKTLVPAAMLKLALCLVDQMPKRPDLLYTLMPDFEILKVNWKQVAETFYKETLKQRYRLFYAQNIQGYCPVDSNTVLASTGTPEPVSQFLLSAGVHPITLPDHVLNALEKLRLKFKRVSSSFVAEVLREKQDLMMITDETKIQLLTYLLENKANLNLTNIKLVPLADGSWTIFGLSKKEMILYRLPTDSDLQKLLLLPGPSQSFIRLGLSHSIVDGLEKQIKTVLEELTTEAVLRLINKIEGITESSELISQNNNPNLTMEYLEVIWRYLRKSCSSSLQLIENLRLHLIPVNGVNSLALLTRSVPLLQISESMESQLTDLFRSLDITQLENLPAFVTNHPLIINQYIFSATAKGVLGVLKTVAENQGRALLVDKISKESDQRKNALQQFLARNCNELNQVSVEDKNFLKILPIFQTLKDSGFKESHYVPAMNHTGVYWFPTGISVPVFLLDLNHPDTMKLAKTLDIQSVDNLAVIINSVFPGINGGEFESIVMESTMKIILAFFAEIIHTNPLFNSQLQKLKFIKKNEREFASASELYDSDDPAVVALFEGEEKFPVGEFANPQYKKLLKSIGLKGSENIVLEDLIGLAHEIHKRPNETKAQLLMEAVEQKASLFNEPRNKAQKKEIQKYNWIKPRFDRGPNYPESLQFVNRVSAPSRIYSDEYITLIGSVAASIRTEAKWTNLAVLFGWNNGPQMTDVIEHFLNVIEWYQNQSSANQSEVQEQRCILESNFQKQAQRMFDDIYAFLEKSLKQAENKTMLLNQIKKLSAKPCVLVDNCLMLPLRCAFECEFSQSYLPHMGSIPKTASSNYEELMKALGVKDAFQAKDYIDILEDFHSTAKGKPLDHTQIRMALHIINECLITHDLTKKPVSGRVVYIPDDKKILHPSSEMWYNPTSDDTSSQKPDTGTGTFPCHPGIKEPAVNAFHIQSKAKALLKPFVQPFGQKEKLVARLRRFLDTNPYSTETLKELIQNADDAGATKMHLIIDSRSLPDDNVFAESWKPLQGPALSIFTDSQFTETDLQGIQDLGEGSKSVDLTKIGQYGVGFNCVYHLTDAPTVLTQVGSERKLCVLDPMIIHAPFATVSSPGCMFTELDTLKKRFPDVFAGYFENEYGIGSGTVFRFALRKQASSLSDQVFNIQELEKSLMQFLKENIHDYLLFLNNVTEIALKKVNTNTQKIENLFVVTKEMNIIAKERVQNYQKAVKEYAGIFQKEKINKMPTSNQIDYELVLKDNEGKEETWLIVQRLGFEQFQHLPETVKKSYESFKLNQLPLVGVAYLLYGNKESRARKSRIFCFLPLPISTGLPVHINGHFALDHDNRRALLNEEIGGQKKGWNIYLMQHIVPAAYCSLICAVRDKIKTKCRIDLKQYHLLFPQLKECDERVKTVEHLEHAISLAVYERMGRRNFDVLPVIIPQAGGAELAVLWFRPVCDKNSPTGYFDSLSEFDFSYPSRKHMYSRKPDTDRIDAEEKFRKILNMCGFNLFASPMQIYDNFTAAGVKVKKISPETVLQFLSGKNADIFSAFLHSDILSSICQILKYCSQWEEFKEHLIGTPLQITQDGSVSIFDRNSLKFVSKHSAVAPHALHCFIHNEIAQAAKLSTSADNSSKKPDSTVCKHFGIPDFEKLLPSLLPETQFRGSEKKVATEFLTNYLSEWPQVKGEPGMNWIREVWDFLGFEISARNTKRKSSELPIAEFARVCLLPLNAWCLLPVTSEANRDILIPIEKTNTIMTDSIKKQLQPDILDVLKKLGFSDLKIDRGVRETDATWLLSLLMDKEQQHASVFVVAVLEQLLQQSIPEIQPEEQKTLLTFLSKNVKEIEKSPNFPTTVRKLPYFTLSDGKHTSLNGCTAFALPENIPEVDSNIWISAAQSEGNRPKQTIQFLRHDSHVLDLIRALGCRELSVAEVYCSFIFKHFDKISATGRIVHMKFIKDGNFVKTLPTNESKQLLTCLRNLRFIRDEVTEELCIASRYVDPRIELFKVMDDKASFPPKPFITDDWLNFLVQNCGLTNEALESKLLEYALKLAKFDPSEELMDKSNYLLDAILNSKKPSSAFIESVKSVPFIVQHVLPDRMLTLHPQRYRSRDNSLQLIPFNGSYASSCSDLVWSIHFLLPPDATYNRLANELRPSEKSLLQNLGVILQPSSDSIAEHLANLCNQIPPGLKITPEMDRVLTVNFTALGNLTLSGKCIATLGCINCVKTNEGFLVKPSQVVIDVVKEIPPHLYKLPTDLGSHHKLLTKLGAREIPTLHLYASILSDLRSKYKTGQLSSEEHKVACRAMRGFLEQLNDMDEAAVESSLQEFQNLYLLCSDKCLHSSKNIVVPDSGKISLSRLEQFRYPVIANRNSIAPSQMHSSTEYCLRKLPSRHRCMLLTSKVREKLNRNFKEAVIDNAPRKLIDDLERNIRTPEFAQGVMRLISHLRPASQNTEIKNVPGDLQRKLSDLSIRIVDHVITHLEECSGSIIQGSEERCSFFLEGNIIYVSQEFCNSQSIEMREILHIRIAEGLKSMLGDIIEPILVYLPLILKCSPSKINRRLNEIQIPKLMWYRENENESDYDTAEEEETHVYTGQHDTIPNPQPETSSGSGTYHLMNYLDGNGIRSHMESENWGMPDDNEDYSDGGCGDIGAGSSSYNYARDDNDDSSDDSDNLPAQDEPDSRTYTYDPRTSSKWIQQARYDLESAKNDAKANSYEWSCYKFHQAAEKSIKAVLIYRQNPVPLSHNLVEVSENIDEVDIKVQATNLQRLLRNTSSMRYPSRDGRIPHDSLRCEDSKKAEKYAKTFFEWAELHTLNT